MKNKKIIILVILVAIAAFASGYIKGSVDVTEKMIDIGTEILDIDLTPRAKQILISRPYLVYMAIENSKIYNGTNPFENHPQARVHWEYCMITNGDYDSCYKTGINKYGEFAFNY